MWLSEASVLSIFRAATSQADEGGCKVRKWRRGGKAVRDFFFVRIES